MRIPTLIVSATFLLTVVPAFAGAPPSDLHGPYGMVLTTYVDDRGLVAYRALKSQPEVLVEYLERLAVLDFVAENLEPADSSYIGGGNYRVEYLTYDWSLNEQ